MGLLDPEGAPPARSLWEHRCQRTLTQCRQLTGLQLQGTEHTAAGKYFPLLAAVTAERDFETDFCGIKQLQKSSSSLRCHELSRLNKLSEIFTGEGPQAKYKIRHRSLTLTQNFLSFL